MIQNETIQNELVDKRPGLVFYEWINNTKVLTPGSNIALHAMSESQRYPSELC